MRVKEPVEARAFLVKEVIVSYADNDNRLNKRLVHHAVTNSNRHAVSVLGQTCPPVLGYRVLMLREPVISRSEALVIASVISDVALAEKLVLVRRIDSVSSSYRSLRMV